jgi:hypothetical protein
LVIRLDLHEQAGLIVFVARKEVINADKLGLLQLIIKHQHNRLACSVVTARGMENLVD